MSSRSTTSDSSSTTRKSTFPSGRSSAWAWAKGAILHWRILRKSLDARRHDDLHFTYAMELTLAEDDARRVQAKLDGRPTFSLTLPNGSTGPSPDRDRWLIGPSSSAPAPPV